MFGKMGMSARKVIDAFFKHRSFFEHLSKIVNKPRIKEIILSKRKQALLAKLEESLIKEAIENNDLKFNFKSAKNEK